MPTSVPYCIPTIAGVARQILPASVLDVGVGFGKYGVLFREYLEIWEMRNVGDYDRSRWKTRIDGIEATAEYLTPLHEYIYDKIHIGDVRTIIDSLGLYDVVIMGDVLEHFDKQAGTELLEALYAHTNKCLLLTFPENCAINHNVLENPFESHRSSWSRKDFSRFPRVASKLIENYSALVAIAKPPHHPPLLTPSFAARRRAGFKGVVANLMVHALGSSAASRMATRILGRPVALHG